MYIRSKKYLAESNEQHIQYSKLVTTRQFIPAGDCVDNSTFGTECD
jgi:hypothetical protein